MIIPFGNRLLVRRKTSDTETEGGILLPSAVTERKFNEGNVVRASEDCKITEGEYVIFGDYSGNEIMEGDEMLLLIMEDDVYCKVQGDA